MRESDEESRDQIVRLERLSQIIFGIVFGFFLLNIVRTAEEVPRGVDLIRWGSVLDAFLAPFIRGETFDPSRLVRDFFFSMIGTFVFAFASVGFFIWWWGKFRRRVQEVKLYCQVVLAIATAVSSWPFYVLALFLVSLYLGVSKPAYPIIFVVYLIVMLALPWWRFRGSRVNKSPSPTGRTRITWIPGSIGSIDDLQGSGCRHPSAVFKRRQDEDRPSAQEA